MGAVSDCMINYFFAGVGPTPAKPHLSIGLFVNNNIIRIIERNEKIKNRLVNYWTVHDIYICSTV